MNTDDKSSGADAMKFIVLIDGFFPRPKFSRDDGRESLWLNTMKEILRRYEPAVLMLAAQQIIETRDPDKDGSMFPKPVECIRVLDKAIETSRLRAMPLLETKEKVLERTNAAKDWSADRVALAKTLVEACASKDRAQREGWIEHLFHFCRKNSRLPTQFEIGALVEEGARYQKVLAELNVKSDGISKALTEYGESIQKHTQDLMN